MRDLNHRGISCESFSPCDLLPLTSPWSVCIEPDAGLAGLIAKNRPQCRLVNACVMDSVKKVQFASAGAQTVQLRGAAGVIGIEGNANAELANVAGIIQQGTFHPIEMECTTLDAVVKSFPPAGGQRPAANERARGAGAGSGDGKRFHIDFLSLDIEGAEPQALRGVDWASTQIDVILAEAKSDTTNAGADHAATALIPILKKRGYSMAFQVGEDIVFIHDDAPPAYRVRAAAFISHSDDVTPCVSAGVCEKMCTCATKRP